MQVAGIREVGAPVELIDVSDPRPLAPDEVLVEVAAAGVGNWDEFVRSGSWDVGGGPPTALGVEAAGTVPDGAEPVDIPAGTGRRRRIEAVADSTPAQEKPTETTTALRAVRIPGTVLGASAPVSAPTPAPGRYRVVFGKPTDKN